MAGVCGEGHNVVADTNMAACLTADGEDCPHGLLKLDDDQACAAARRSPRVCCLVRPSFDLRVRASKSGNNAII